MSLVDELKPLIGLRCEDLRLNVGGSLILYVGPRSSETTLTEWRIHIEPAWRLEDDGNPIIGSFDTPTESGDTVDAMLKQLNVLRGTHLTDITTGSPILDLTFTIADRFHLRTFAHTTQDGENWEFRHNSGHRFAMKAGSVCDWIQSTESPDETTA